MELVQQASKTGFRAEILEKVWHLMRLLEAINRDSFLENRLALKGGTALNLFLFQVPRLSVDIDLNYIGSSDRQVMLQERIQIDSLLEAIFLREGMSILCTPDRHAGGKWRLKYPSALGNFGNIEVDTNFMFRIPLWNTATYNSHAVGGHSASKVRLMNIYEIIGGKVTALFARKAARDLFDVYQLCSLPGLERDKLRLASILYSSSSTVDLRSISLDNLSCNANEIKRLLIPLLKQDQQMNKWTQESNLILDKCKNWFLSHLFPLDKNEVEFLNHFHDQGIINPTFLTDDLDIIEKIHQLPGLKWKLHVNSKYRTEE
ncbi:MAG: nucleotidyl transferase AbiEii/AbiGii toxin family protein [Verrucomicrobia bacterium]|nr:nucleotidyl transferase AbiEii/AbiGii toxin family protein [Verrucomicrobiota bacterium]